MATPLSTAAPTATTSTAAVPDLATIAALLQDLTAKVDAKDAKIAALEAQVAQARAAVPKIVKRQAEDPHNTSARRAAFAGLKPGQAAGGSRQLPVDSHGKRIPDALLKEFGPRYESGDAVAIRRDVARDGFAPGVTWGDVLDKVKSDGVGVVLRQSFLTKLGEWKYVVHVPGLTRQGRGDGFYDHELRPA